MAGGKSRVTYLINELIDFSDVHSNDYKSDSDRDKTRDQIEYFYCFIHSVFPPLFCVIFLFLLFTTTERTPAAIDIGFKPRTDKTNIKTAYTILISLFLFNL